MIGLKKKWKILDWLCQEYDMKTIYQTNEKKTKKNLNLNYKQFWCSHFIKWQLSFHQPINIDKTKVESVKLERTFDFEIRRLSVMF